MSELRLLREDLAQVADAINASAELFSEIARLDDVGTQCYRHALADLLLRIQQLCTGMLLMLEERLELPLLILTRALFEAATTLGYLLKCAAPQREATILFAYTWLSDQADFWRDSSLRAERTEALKRLPADLVAIAEARLKRKPRTWSGKTFRIMALHAGVHGYDLAYGALSGQAHASRAGRYIRFVPKASSIVDLEIDHDITEKDAEIAANFARRTLRAALANTWRELGGQPIVFSAESPERWRSSSS